MARVSKQEQRNAHEGLEPQASFKTQLRRLAHHLGAFHQITVEFRRRDEDKYPRLAILRPEHKPVVFRTGHPAERNLELLRDLAHAAVESGGAGMSYEAIAKACNTPSAADKAPALELVQPTVATAAGVRTGRLSSGPNEANVPRAAAPTKAEGSVARAWAIADSMPTGTRKQIVAAMVAAGVKPNTAAAQYVRWNKAKRGGGKF